MLGLHIQLLITFPFLVLPAVIHGSNFRLFENGAVTELGAAF